MLALSCLASPACAGSDLASGDGSGADNERLLPGLYPPEPVLASSETLSEPPHPPVNIDWSVGLRGTYTKTGGRERFDTRIVPAISLEHQGIRSTVSFDGSAEVTKPNEGEVDVTALRLGYAGGYALDSVTAIRTDAALTLTQPLAGTPGISDNVDQPAQVLSGTAGIGIQRQFGRFNVDLGGSVERTAYGETTLIDGSTNSNDDENFWGLDGTLRVGYRLTPITEVFTQAGFGRDIFDQSSASGLRRDATETTLRAGLKSQWGSVLEASASTGIGIRRYDEDDFGEVRSQLYDASIIYTPDPTLRLAATLGTRIDPAGPDAPGTTRIEYLADIELDYTVNSWLAWRANADWRRSTFTDSSDIETSYGLGLGANYKLNGHTSLTADYGFDRAESQANGEQDAHQVSLGLRLSR